jgi:hypothetical protein
VHALATARSPGTSGPARGYERRRPEDTLLHRVVAACWPTLRARAEDAGGLPGFVVDEVEGYLRCGILEHGVAHLACRRCGHAMVVATVITLVLMPVVYKLMHREPARR